MMAPLPPLEAPQARQQAGFWPRRITDEHRMVYRVDADASLIAQLRYHD